MRQFAILLMTLIPYLGMSQQNDKPQWYLNGNEVDFNCIFLNPSKLKSINVEKDTPNGEIFLITKEIPWKYQSLENLLKTTAVYSLIIDKSITPFYIIDGKLVKDKTDIKIDDSYFAKVTLNKLADVKGVEAACQELVLVDIKLTLTDPKKEIYIRGDENPDLDNLIKLKK